MNRLRRFWSSGIVGKGMIFLAGFVVLCCAPLMLFAAVAPKPAPTVTSARVMATAGSALDVTTAPAATAAPTVAAVDTGVPTVEVTATIAPTETSVQATETPVSSDTPATTSVSSEVQSYLGKLVPPLKEFATTSTELSVLMRNPLFADKTWRRDIDLRFTSIQSVYTTVKAIDPVPVEAQEVHNALVDALKDCDTSTRIATEGFDNQDTDKILEGVKYTTSCNQKIRDAQPLIKKLVNS